MTDLGDTPSDPSVGRYDKADEPPILRSSPGLPRSNTRSPGPRSPKLSSLPENSSPDTPGASLTQTDVADFAPPSRQYTDSTTTTSEFSFVPATNRSSAVPFYQHFHSPSGSEHQLQAANQILEQQLSSYRALKTSLKTVPAPPSSHPRLPKDEDFKEFPDVHKNLSWKIKVYSDKEPPHAVDITSIIILLHDHNGDESTLKAFTKKHLAQPQTALLFLGGLCRIRGPTNGEVFGLSWADESPDGIHYHDASRIILKHVIGRILVSKCNFSPSNIAILGQGQGGTLALTIASIWNTTRFGGVITVDGPAPEYTSQSPQLPRSPTPILILGGKLGLMNPQAEQRIKDLFTYVDTELRPGATSVRLSSTMSDEDEIETIHDFLDHSLRQQEWETQTILAFGKPVHI
jgi:predicted esterase